MQGGHNFIDIVGETFGKLTVLRRADNYIEPKTGKKTARFACLCSCGQETTVIGADLRRGHTTQCKACGHEAAALALRKYSLGDTVNGRKVTALLPTGKYETCCVSCETVAETSATISPCQTCRKVDEAKARSDKKAAWKADVASRTKTHEGDCVVCGVHFKRPVIGNGTLPTSCSKTCSLRRLNAIRTGITRAKAWGVTYERVDPFKIFARDGWKCMLCHEPVARHLRGTTHGLAAELDHRTPLEWGGSHTEENVQTSHRSCNAAKLRADLASAAWNDRSSAKMNPEKVTALIADRRVGATTTALAEKYGIGVRYVREILQGKVWKQVAGERLATLRKPPQSVVVPKVRFVRRPAGERYQRTAVGLPPITLPFTLAAVLPGKGFRRRTRRTRRTFTVDQKEHALFLLDAGYSSSDVARAFGLTRHDINRWRMGGVAIAA